MKYLIALRNVIFAALFLTILLGVLHFPYDVDAPLTAAGDCGRRPIWFNRIEI